MPPGPSRVSGGIGDGNGGKLAGVSPPASSPAGAKLPLLSRSRFAPAPDTLLVVEAAAAVGFREPTAEASVSKLPKRG